MGEVDVNTEILQRLTRVETKLDMQLNAAATASEALQSAKSAHHRIEDHKHQIDEMRAHYDGEVKAINARIEAEAKALDDRIKTENQERKADRRWLIATVMTAAGLVIAFIKLF